MAPSTGDRLQPPATIGGPSPYRFKLQYTGEAWDNATGGLHQGTAYLQNLDAQLVVDTDRAFGWTGGRFFVEGYYNTSSSLSAHYVNAVQDPSLLDTDGVSMWRLYQAYYDQNLGKTDILFGIYDLETEFGSTKPMDVFFNGAYAWTSTLDHSGLQGLNGPSTYPDTALAMRIRRTIDDQWSIQGAVLDGMSDDAQHPSGTNVLFNGKFGALAIGEVDYRPIVRTKIMAGYWAYTGKFETQDEFNSDGSIRKVYGSNGGYVGGTTRLFTLEGARGLDGFATLGIADSIVNQVDHSLNMGVTFTGPLDARPSDRLGFGVGIAQAGDPYKRAQIAQGNGVYSYETNFELTYRARITSWLTLQPDIQYFVHPNFDPAQKNDFLFGLHFEIGRWFDL